MDIAPHNDDLDTVTLPLHQCPPLAQLEELFEHWGDTCSPPTDEELRLPPGYFRLTCCGQVRYFTMDDAQGLIVSLEDSFRRNPHTAQQ